MTAPPVPPAGQPVAPTAGTAGQIAIASEIVRLPQELAARLLQSPRTVFLGGTVTGQTPDGNVQIRSQFGEIAVRPGTGVPADRQVSLQIPALAGKTAELTPAQLTRTPIPASLLLPRPAAGAPANTLQPTAGTTTTVTGQPQAAPLPQPNAAGQPPQSASQPSSPTPTPTGTPPASQPASAPATIAGGPIPSTAVPSGPVPSGGTATATPAQPGTGGAVASPPPNTAVPTPTATPQAGGPPIAGQPATPVPQLGRPTLSAQVVTQAGDRPAPPNPQVQAQTPSSPTAASPAATQAGQPPAANTASARNAPATMAALEAGRIAAAARPETAASVLAHREGGEAALPADPARRVPVLREAVSALSAADPALATQFVRSVMPQGNSQLAATLLFFLSATRGGDIRGWVGDRVATRLEDAGRADLLPRLSAELSAPRAAPEPAAGEWRSQTIPLYQESELGGLTLHVRNAGDEDGASADAEAAGKRFLIDLDLSRMGPLQLDGLVRDKRLDLTIRSQAAFPARMRDDMRTLFRDAGETVGLQGGLTFQAGGHDWVTVATARGAG